MRDQIYKRYLLALLAVILASNAMDRLALGLLLQDIKTDLSLSDTQLGVLTGIAFALFYSVMGIPIARWADRGNRVAIVATTTALWSAAVAMCALAGSFAQLLLIRIGVAVGEAGCMPPAHSLIASHFTRAERPRAVARYMLGAPASALVGYLLAGWLNEFYGWRATFVILGLPGIALAVLAGFTLREPRVQSRPGATDASSAASRLQAFGLAPASEQSSIKETCALLWSTVTFRHLLLSFSVMSFFASGIAKWQPAFFMRSYGLNTGEVGSWFTLIVGASGVLGTYFGGELASRFWVNKESLQLRIMAVAFCSFGLVSALAYLSASHYLAFAFMALAMVGGSMLNGPFFATIQTLVPERMRATSIAIIYLFANLIGMGIGPLAAGALSDALRPLFGEESLRCALLALTPGYAWAAWHIWRASRTVTGDIEAIRVSCEKSLHPVTA
jgi:MFS transporter, Spinster family, sphingosine-1-phosphate transporter